MSLRLRLAALALLALPLAGCVSFEVAPVATMGCDAALAGAWLPESGDVGPGDRPLVATDQCVLSGQNGPGGPETQHFSTFAFEGADYVAVEADDVLNVTDAQGKVVETWPQTRVELYRYRLEGDRLWLWTVDADVAQAVGGDGITVHTDAPVDPATKQPAPSMLDRRSVYLAGNREAIAGLLHRRGDALYAGLKPERATVLHRVAQKDAP
jgi:hypothetical protein